MTTKPDNADDFPLPELPRRKLRFEVEVNQLGQRLEHTDEDLQAYARATLRSWLAAHPEQGGAAEDSQLRKIAMLIIRNDRAEAVKWAKGLTLNWDGSIEIDEEAATPPTPAPREQQDSGQWISVEERLPGEQGCDSEDVLCFLNGHCAITDNECRNGGGWGIRIGFFDAEKQCFRVHGRPESFVTHWMPLPAPPASQKEQP